MVVDQDEADLSNSKFYDFLYNKNLQRLIIQRETKIKLINSIIICLHISFPSPMFPGNEYNILNLIKRETLTYYI